MTRPASAQQAITVAERLLCPERVLTAVPSRPGASLQGLAGTALLHARLATVDPAFAAAASTHWTAAATHYPCRSTTPAGVFATPGGLAASLVLGEHYLPDPGPHQRAVQQAARWLSAQVTLKAATDQECLRRAGEAAASRTLYDAVTGLAGTGRNLLAARTGGHNAAEEGLAAALATLTTMINTPSSSTRPGWWLPADGHTTLTRQRGPGVAETGMAHGIAGPLALLSVAASAGWTVAGQTTAIRTAAYWLLAWQDRNLSTWPPHVTGDELDTAQPGSAPGRRDAWCYGTAGISRALNLASRALGDSHLAAAAEVALIALFRRPSDRWDTRGPTLCHGTAGVLQSINPSDSAAAHLAATATMAAYDPNHTFAFQHQHADAVTDDPGLLTGAAGVALALADYGGIPAPAGPTFWDAVLLLS